MCVPRATLRIACEHAARCMRIGCGPSAYAVLRTQEHHVNLSAPRVRARARHLERCLRILRPSACAPKMLCARRLLLLLLLLKVLRMPVTASRVCLTVGHHGCARGWLLLPSLLEVLRMFVTASRVCLTVGHHGCTRRLLLLLLLLDCQPCVFNRRSPWLCTSLVVVLRMSRGCLSCVFNRRSPWLCTSPRAAD